METVFVWCKECMFYDRCYHWDNETGEEIIGGPDFLEPVCGEGPAKKEPPNAN